MVYLTHYTEYPIYEPAEGGYYYAGNEAGESYECCNEDEAKFQLDSMRDDLEEQGFEVYEDCAVLKSKYIGENETWVIESKYGSENRGWEPYQ